MNTDAFDKIFYAYKMTDLNNKHYEIWTNETQITRFIDPIFYCHDNFRFTFQYQVNVV